MMLNTLEPSKFDALNMRRSSLQPFAPAVQFLDALTRFGQEAAFEQLVQQLHALGLDWWLTPTSMEPRAGRSENIYWHGVAMLVAVRCTSSAIQVGINKTHDQQQDSDKVDWLPLSTAVVEQVIEWVSSKAIVPPLTHRQPYWPVRYLELQNTLCTKLTQGALNNNYLLLPAELVSKFFPAEVLGTNEQEAAQQMHIRRADGQTIQTDVRGARLKNRTLFTGADLTEGDYALLHKKAPLSYELEFLRQADFNNKAPALLPQMTKLKVDAMTPTPSSQPLNQILFGPPGTGKTYATVNKTLEILEPQWLQALREQELPEKVLRQQMKQRFDALHAQGRVQFTTFHQSFSYEDFVEGIRAVTDEDTKQLSYAVVDGVFKALCNVAAVTTTSQPVATPMQLEQRQVWKMSLGNTQGDDAGIYAECIQGGYVLLGYGGDIDFSGSQSRQDVLRKYQEADLSVANNDYAVTSVATFVLKMKVGDLVVVSDGNFKFRAIGEIASDYEYAGVHDVHEDGYAQRRRVRWLRQYSPSLPYSELLEKSFSQMTLYALKAPNLVKDKLARLLGNEQNPADEGPANDARVLVIDEINRGNVSRIFGELITLLEPSKRAGAPEALTVTLPYSKQPFSVPSNIYIIGTMNTTDRSLAGLDVALRRRFAFEELMPDASLLQGVVVNDGQYSVDIGQMLTVMNERIEALLDREHQLGHAFFMPLRDEGAATLPKLGNIFRQSVLPLLQEYFFDDWERIAWVLNDHLKPHSLRFVQVHGKPLEALFGGVAAELNQRKRWRLNPEAFEHLGSFAGIVQVQAATDDAQPAMAAM